jgi:hypothetical protein
MVTPVDLDPCVALARDFGLAVVEDAPRRSAARTRAPDRRRRPALCVQLQRQQDIDDWRRRAIVSDNQALATAARHLTNTAVSPTLEF